MVIYVIVKILEGLWLEPLYRNNCTAGKDRVIPQDLEVYITQLIGGVLMKKLSQILLILMVTSILLCGCEENKQEIANLDINR